MDLCFINKSIFLQALLESMWIFILWVSTFVILVLEIKSRQNLNTTYSTISSLQSQTQTASVLAQIETEYANLKNHGDDWLIRFNGLVVINSILMCLFIQDSLQFLSLIVRKIGIKGLNNNLKGALFLDLIHFIGAIYLIIQYCTYYRIDRTLSRSEEKNYRMFLATQDAGVQTKVIFTYLIIVIIYRMLFQMSYFETFGALVQIIAKMIIECFKFLVLSFFFLVTFTIIGHNLFYDISEFSSIFYSFNTMYQSTFGAFDFAIYTNSTLTSEYYGRIFLSIFLLGMVILIMNFLIAILSEVYSYYTGVASALHKREIIKLRIIYEPHKYYYCLVKAPIVVNFYMIIMAPLVIILKSEKLNNGLILFHYCITVIYFEFGLLLNMFLTLPFFCLILVFLKLRYLASKSKGVLDVLLRIIDIFVVIFTSLIYIIFLYISNVVLETRALFKTNFIKIVGIYSKQYRYINLAMDGSINKQEKDQLDDVQSQKLYFKFKKFVNPLRSKTIKYNATNCMISEVSVCLMVACMKIIKREIQLATNHGVIDDSIPLFIPTEYVIHQLRDTMCLNEQLRAILFGDTYQKQIDIDSKLFTYLISVLADKTIGGIENQIESDIVDTGSNIITTVATIGSHKERIQFWRNKLYCLFLQSNPQWLLDQFQLCKTFLYLNSYQADISEVNDEILQVNQTLREYNDNYILKTKSFLPQEVPFKDNNEKLNIEEEALKEEPTQKIYLIDIPTFIGPMIGFERKIRNIIRQDTQNGEYVMSKTVRSNCEAANLIALTRFLSSNMQTCYSACNKYASS